MERYVDALCGEIDLVSQGLGIKQLIHTIFFGGGTPSHLPNELTARIMEHLRGGFIWAEDMEISLEANPGTVSLVSLRWLRMMGFNRISLGVQSTDDQELKMLGRIHNFSQVKDAVEMARAAGFENLNLDLIYGLPGQSLEDWQQTAMKVVELKPEHLSLYALTLEDGTELSARVRNGVLPEPDADTAPDQYEWSGDYLAGMGYSQYEISNWARGDRYRCRHNLQYWKNESYIGFGAGAHSYYNHARQYNPDAILEYIHTMKLCETNPKLHPIIKRYDGEDTFEQMQDEMMLGLRLVKEGVIEKEFLDKFGQSPWDIFGEIITDLIDKGLLEEYQQPLHGWRLTKRGRSLGNQVFMQFVGD